ncbi:MAG: hypothetical protein QNL04_09745, partial [SAR324 cluster bacterium]|nr:hypothetical protein [SAR324 cluster bacterium]
SHSDRSVQITTNNTIRNLLLERLGCVLNPKELEQFQDIGRFNKVEISDIETVFAKILEANKKSKCFHHETLELEITDKYWFQLNQNTALGLSTYLRFTNSLFIKKIRIPTFFKIKFFIKCLIRFSNAT